MKEITLRISDKKLSFFLELVNQLGLEVVEQEEYVIPQWQQEQVLKAKQEIKEGTAELNEWASLKDDLFEKYDLK